MNFIPKIEYIELITGTPKTITFDSPPEGDPFGENLRSFARSTESSSGVRQTQHSYNMQRYSLKFIFQSETVKDALVDFFYNHAFKGGEFDYYPSSDEVDFETYYLVNSSLKLGRPIPSAILGEFEYDISFQIERVI